MDRFLVPTGIARHKLRKTKKAADPKLKQTKLTDSPKVVVLEEIERLKESLKNAEDPETLLAALEKLSSKLPPVEVLLKTKIGTKVKALQSHSDSRISTLSTSIVNKWTQHVKRHESLPIIDVRCGKEANERRETARKMIKKALESSTLFDLVVQYLARNIELQAFLSTNKNISNGYPRLIRTIVKHLNQNPDTIQSIHTRILKIPDFIQNLKKAKLIYH